MYKPIALALVLAAGDAGVTWPEESQYKDGEAQCAKPIPEGSRNIRGLQVVHGAVDAAERIFGPSPLHTQGDAGSFKAWRCWTAASGDGTVLYVARGEVEVELQILGSEMAFAWRDSCPKSKLINRRMATANGLRLGLSRSEVESKVGPASKSGRGWYEKVCLSPRPMTEKEKADFKAEPGFIDFTTATSVRVVEREGKAIGLEVSWSETY